MLTRSLITFGGFIIMSTAYMLEIPDSELKSALEDPEEAENIFKCLLATENEICDLVGKVLKDIMQEVIDTDCANCNAEQNKMIGEFFAAVSVKHPEKIELALDVYDPQRENLKKYSSRWRERGIKI